MWNPDITDEKGSGRRLEVGQDEAVRKMVGYYKNLYA